MKNAQPNTRDAIISSAQRLVQEASYDGFSFRDIAEEVGIRKASIYHHFETKEALGVAMLKSIRGQLKSWCDGQRHRPAADRLQAYCFEFYGDGLRAGTRLCPGGAFAAGWDRIPDAVRHATLALMQVHSEFLIRALEDGAADDSLVLPKGSTAETAADWFAATVQGALITARTEGGRARFDALCTMTLKQLSP